MATNIIVARGGVEYVPPISLAFWRWLTVFLILFPFFYNEILKNKKYINKEFWKLFFLGSMGCGICGAFPFIAGMSTTMANMGIIYTSSPIFIIILSVIFFNDKINFSRVIGLVLCLIGVLAIISKGNLDLLINFKFTSGDLWMIGAAMGWAVYSIYLLNWKSKFSLMARFTLIAMFGTISLLPFYILEEIFYFNTAFNSNFLFWVLFAAISPGIIAFTLYTRVQKYLGASLTGFTLYIFSIYSAIYGIILFDEALLNFHYFGAAFVFAGVYLARKITS
jgi:drug/metabolite transporter (DMT)-like permease